MNETYQPQMEVEYDLKETIKTMVKFWKLFLPLVIIGGLLMSGYGYLNQKTTTSATVFINNSEFSNQMGNFEHKKAIAEKLEIPLEKLPDVSIQSVKENSNLFTIIASTNDIQKNVELANAWANLLVTKGKEGEVTLANRAMTSASKDLEKATHDLNTFLAKNNLSNMTYSQLEELTGIYLNSSRLIVLQQDAQSLPVLHPDELTQLSQLLQAKINAQQVYSDIYKDKQTSLYYIENRNNYSIMELAKVPDISLKSVIVHFFLGSLVTIILGIVVIFIIQWWKKPSPEK